MKIALVYPPTCDPTAPYLAVPMLTGFLRAHGVDVLPVDANVEAYDRLLGPAALAPPAASGPASATPAGGCARPLGGAPLFCGGGARAAPPGRRPPASTRHARCSRI